MHCFPRWFVASVPLLALWGCSSSDVSSSDVNGRLAQAVCDKAYECLTPEVLESSSSVYGLTRDACPMVYAAGAPLGCTPGTALAQTAVDKCLKEVAAQSCSLVKTSGAVVTPYSCTSLCPEPPDDAGAEDAPVANVRRDGSVLATDADVADAGAIDAATPTTAADGGPGGADALADAAVD